MVPAGDEVDRELKLGVLEIVAADIDDVVDELMGVDELALEEERAAADAREVEEVVDESSLEDDVAADHLEDGAERVRGVGVAEHGGDGGEDGGERCAELVRERGEEAVLGEVGGLGLGAGGLFAEHADAFFGGSFLDA